MRCDRCDGRGWSGPVHVHRGNGKHEWRERVECYNCRGSGSISEEQARARSVGRLHMVERTDRGESLRECSKRLGIGPAALGDYEHGRTWTDGYQAARRGREGRRTPGDQAMIPPLPHPERLTLHTR